MDIFSTRKSFIAKGIMIFIFSISFLPMFVLLGVGWIKNFLRWSLPAIGFCFPMSLVMMNVKLSFLLNDILILWAWLPIITTMLLAILIHPSKEPIKNLFEQVYDSPALVLFMFYGLSIPLFTAFYDEVYTPAMFYIAILTTFILSLGLYLILRSKTKKRRRFGMVSAFVSAILIVVLFYSLR